LSSKAKISIGVLVPVIAIVTASVVFFLWRRPPRKAGPTHSMLSSTPGPTAGAQPELEGGYGMAITELETREYKPYEMDQPVPELSDFPRTNGAISELAAKMPDHTMKAQGEKATTPAISTIPAATHTLATDAKLQELETNSPSNLTHMTTENNPASRETQQQPEPSSAPAICTVSQSTGSAELEQLRAEEARLMAQIVQIQNLMQLDQERQRIRERIQSMEADKGSP